MTVKQWSNTTEDPIFERQSPCVCGCADCEEWARFSGIKNLVVGDKDKCFSSDSAENGETYVELPDITTLTSGWCVTIKSTKYPIAVIPYEAQGVKIYVDGVAWDGIYINATWFACICFDGKNWVATGNVTGYNGN
jgi:hypothetical protein